MQLEHLSKNCDKDGSWLPQMTSSVAAFSFRVNDSSGDSWSQARFAAVVSQWVGEAAFLTPVELPVGKAAMKQV